MTTTVDTSERRIFTCTEKCGKSFDTKPKWTRHSKKCKGLKTCTVPNCSCPDFSGNIIGYVFEVCANLDRTAEKRNQLHAKAPERKAHHAMGESAMDMEKEQPEEAHARGEKPRQRI